MPETRELEKQLRLATRTGKYIVGRKEVLRSLKGSKMLVWSASANIPPEILDQSRSAGIPALRYEGNPIQLGRACGIPFKVSVIAIKSPGDADFSAFKAAQDYSPSQNYSSPPLSSLGPISPIAAATEAGLTGRGMASTLEPERVTPPKIQPASPATEEAKVTKLETGKETSAQRKEAPKTIEREKKKTKVSRERKEEEEEEKEKEKGISGPAEGEKEEKTKKERSFETLVRGDVVVEDKEGKVTSEKETAKKGKKENKKSETPEKKKKRSSPSKDKASKSAKD